MGSRERGSGGGRIGESAQILDAPTKILNTHRTTQHNTTQHNTTQHNTTQHNNDTPHNTTGDPAQGGPQNGLIKKSCLGQEAVWAKRRSGPKVVWAKSGGRKVVRKTKKNMEKTKI